MSGGGTARLVPESWSKEEVTILEDGPTLIRARYHGETPSGHLRMKYTPGSITLRSTV